MSNNNDNEPTIKTRVDHERTLHPWEVNAVIDWFLYRLKPEDRGKLMRELPTTYNKLMGRKIMGVENIAIQTEDDPEPLRETP